MGSIAACSVRLAVKFFLTVGSKVRLAARLVLAVLARLGLAGDLRLGECLVRLHAHDGFDGQAALDEVARRHADVAPVLESREGVFADKEACISSRLESQSKGA